MRKTLIFALLAGIVIALTAAAALVGAASISTTPEPAYVSPTAYDP